MYILSFKPQRCWLFNQRFLYCCEACGVDLTAHKKLLQAHHKNGVKSDNSTENLRALCVDCHRKQPLHDRMFVTHADMQLLNQLRREQNIIKSPSNYQQAFCFSDPSMHGVLYRCQENNYLVPEVGYMLKDANEVIRARLELAWPHKKSAVAIAEADIVAARELGWTARSMIDAFDVLESVKNKK